MNLSTGSRYFAHKIPEKTEIAKLHIFTANGQNFYAAYQATENDSLFSNVESWNIIIRRHQTARIKQKWQFLCIYSPEQFILRPRDSTFLDLKCKLTEPKKINVHINFLPKLKERCLSIENHAWESNKLKDSTSQLDILNKSFYNTTNIKKNQEISYIFIMNQTYYEKFFSLCNNIKWKIKYHSLFLVSILHKMETDFFLYICKRYVLFLK